MSFISYFVEKFFKLNILFDSELRTTIFIGVTGLIVAVIIFIAEFMNEKKRNLYKRVILYKTDIKRKFAFLLFVLIFMWFCDILNFDCDKSFFSYIEVFHLSLEVILNGLIFLSFWYTGDMFFTAIKLCVETDFFNKSLDDYVYNCLVEIRNKIDTFFKKEKKAENKKMEKLIEHYKSISLGKPDDEIVENYQPICSTVSSTISSFDYSKLINLMKIYEEDKLKLSKVNGFDINPVVYLSVSVGDKVNKNTVVFYVNKKFLNVFQNLSSIIIFSDNTKYINDEIKMLIDDLFDMAGEFSEPDIFDNNKRLYNFFELLYDEKFEYVKTYALSNVEIMYRKMCKNYDRNSQYCSFINSLSLLAYKKGAFDDYIYVSKFALYLYSRQLLYKNIDIKEVSYRFANSFFNIHLICLKETNEIECFDNLVSLLFRFILNLMKNKYFDAVYVILDNIHFRNRKDPDEEELDKSDIIKFQFVCGFVYCLIAMSDNNLLSGISSDDKKEIKKIITNIKYNLFDCRDAWKTIYNFKKYFNYKSKVQNAYGWFDFDFIDHKYKNSWSGWSLDERIILKEMLMIFNISYTERDQVDCSFIDKDDKYYYQRLLELFKSDEKTKLENYLELFSFNKKNLIISLETAIKDAETKEAKFNRTNSTKKELVKKFGKIIKEKMTEDSILISYLRKFNKVVYSEEKLKSAYGLVQLIPRDLFFGTIFGLENIASDIGGVFPSGIEKKFIDKLDSISIINKKIEDVLSDLGSSLNEYVIISNYLNSSYLHTIGFDYISEKLKYKDYNIDVLRIPEVNNIYLLKKQHLPILNYCKFSDNWEKNCVNGSIYYKFTDLSIASRIRKEIIDNSPWLKEKGTVDEQHDYLKENFKLSTYLAFKIINIDDAVVYKFNVEENF